MLIWQAQEFSKALWNFCQEMQELKRKRIRLRPNVRWAPDETILLLEKLKEDLPNFEVNTDFFPIWAFLLLQFISISTQWTSSSIAAETDRPSVLSKTSHRLPTVAQVPMESCSLQNAQFQNPVQ